jgi:hypothetical protein
MCGSKCFGRFLAHHQELTTALAALVLLLERGGSSVVGRARQTMTNNAATATL